MLLKKNQAVLVHNDLLWVEIEVLSQSICKRIVQEKFENRSTMKETFGLRINKESCIFPTTEIGSKMFGHFA